jgi:hypothetical protein
MHQKIWMSGLCALAVITPLSCFKKKAEESPIPMAAPSKAKDLPAVTEVKAEKPSTVPAQEEPLEKRQTPILREKARQEAMQKMTEMLKKPAR